MLVLSVSLGAGHRTTAEALCRVYRENFGGEAYHIDFMRYALPGFSDWVEGAYYWSTQYSPFVYKWLYHREDRGDSWLQRAESQLGIRGYIELLQQYRPHAILTTHSFPAVVVSALFPRFPIPNGVVVTDYVSHCIWVNPNTQRYFVAHDGMVDELKAEGAAPGRIRVTGIPVRPIFKERFQRLELRHKLALEPDRFTVLVMSGGNAVGPVVGIIKTLGQYRERVQVIAIAGRNQGVYRQVRAVFQTLGLTGKVLGFMENVQEYMAASDLLISKAGGLTTTEALVMGLPMAIIRPTPGQEDGNTRFLERSGAGVYLNNLADLAKTLGVLLEQPGRLERMRRKALDLARPEATEAILAEMEQLMEIAEDQPRSMVFAPALNWSRQRSAGDFLRHRLSIWERIRGIGRGPE
ncbi:processive 1,2-diacylglycerol beta-glucosyltransferase [Hydrogenispora ethanolica]|uniref:Processive 1,2-diacylglycerol beta-glucosyltransferase n=1 Tax=Hydrogenispora ethanolica TaxID=1082276 RepID=A0A4R1S779_HYDET|nr:glycosyltransferase [Hydrogenispora ethanolica]TCL75178.1 processive 1,2-diacylglycerol beta-glucosyltransferase [Hydrogenispora ethanolica]